MDNEIPPQASSGAGPSDSGRLARDIARVRDDLAAAVREAAAATRLFGAPEAVTIADLDRALAYLQLTPLPRDCDPAAFTDAGWSRPRDIEALIKAGEYLAQLRARARTVFNEGHLAADAVAIRAGIATKSGNPFRVFDGGYRRNIARLRAGLRAPLPKSAAARLEIVDLAIALTAAEGDFARWAPAGCVFGALWQGDRSDWKALDNVLRWRLSHPVLSEAVWPRLAAATPAQLAAGDQARRALYAALAAWRSGMAAIAAKPGPGPADAFGAEALTVKEWDTRYAAWLGGN